MTLFCRNCVAWLIMNPSPALALTCSATTSASQATPRLCRRPTSICGSARQHDVLDQLRSAQVQYLAELGEFRVHAADAGEGVQVQRDRGAERDQGQLG